MSIPPVSMVDDIPQEHRYSRLKEEKTNPKTIPRMINVQLSHIEFLSEFHHDSIINFRVAVHGARHSLRSSSFKITANHIVDNLPLDLAFSLEYVHHLKNTKNAVQIMIQKRGLKTRKRKTFASSSIGLATLLQRDFSGYLDLTTDRKRDTDKSADDTLVDGQAGLPAGSAVLQSQKKVIARLFANMRTICSFETPEEQRTSTNVSFHYDDDEEWSSTSSDEEERDMPEVATLDPHAKMKDKKLEKLKGKLKKKKKRKEDEGEKAKNLDFSSEDEDIVEDNLVISDTDEPGMESGDSLHHEIKESITVRVERIFNPGTEVELPDYVLLANSSTRRGRIVEEWLSRVDCPFNNNVIVTEKKADVELAVREIVSKLGSCEEREYKLLTILAGDDSYVREVMVTFIERMGKVISSFDFIRFGIIPVDRRKKNDLALHLATVDPLYGSLFISSDFRELFEKKDRLSEEDGKQVESRISRYISEAKSTYNFNIAVVQIPMEGQTLTVPFARFCWIGTVIEKERQDDPISHMEDVEITFWYNKKGVGQKCSVKASFQYVAITLVQSNIGAVRIEHPHPNSLVMTLRTKDLKGSAYKKLKSCVSETTAVKKSEDKKKPFDMSLSITKAIVSVAEGKPFVVNVDGIEHTGCKFATVSLQGKHHPTFPVSITLSSPEDGEEE